MTVMKKFSIIVSRVSNSASQFKGEFSGANQKEAENAAIVFFADEQDSDYDEMEISSVIEIK
jgi:hypothetical protein